MCALTAATSGLAYQLHPTEYCISNRDTAMANDEHVAMLRKGVDAWNEWRFEKPLNIPDLSGTNLSGANLSGANLSGADLGGADLDGANLSNTIMADGAKMAAAFTKRSTSTTETSAIA